MGGYFSFHVILSREGSNNGRGREERHSSRVGDNSEQWVLKAQAPRAEQRDSEASSRGHQNLTFRKLTDFFVGGT